MPTYEYECQDCKECFEIFQNIKAPHLKTCPKCGGKLQRLISGGAGIIFKGPGFYATNYKKGKKESPQSCPLKDSSCNSCPAAAKKE